MFGFNSWSDFTNKAAESLQNAAESAKSGVKTVSSKTKEFTASFPDNAKSSLNKLQENVSTFVEEQRQQFQQVEHETELRKRRKERKAKLLKYGIPPWHIFEETLNKTSKNEEKNENNENNTSNENNNNSNNSNNGNENGIPNKRNCTYEELRLLILKLCEDENTFLVEAPSSTSVFPFSMDTALPYANAALNYDPILPRIRYKLVPKKISETQFWKNYFYRVQLIRESMGYPKLDLSANAPSMALLQRQIANAPESPENNKINLNENKNKNKINTNNNSQNQSLQNESQLKNLNQNQNDNNTNQSIFESTTDNNGTNTDINNNNNNRINNNDNDINNNISNNLLSTNASSSDGSELLVDAESDNGNNNLTQSVVSIDSSESITTGISHNDSSIVKITKKTDENNRLKSVSSETLNENDDDDDDEDDDYMASNDLHIDALSPEARARMQKELGLNKNKSNSVDQNKQNSSNIDNIDDTDDVDALLADVNVDDDVSDISDDELAKVMSEVENT